MKTERQDHQVVLPIGQSLRAAIDELRGDQQITKYLRTVLTNHCRRKGFKIGEPRGQGRPRKES